MLQETTVKNLFLLMVAILTLDTFQSIRFAHRRMLSRLAFRERQSVSVQDTKAEISQQIRANIIFGSFVESIETVKKLSH